MLEEIADKEKIIISKAEVETQAEDLAKRYNVGKEEFNVITLEKKSS